MKKLLLILLCVPLIGLGQIKKIERAESKVTKSEIGSLSNILGEMKILKHESSGTIMYTIEYRNCKYMETVSYSEFDFFETGDDLDNLYSMIIEGFNFTNKEVLYKHALNYKIYNEIILDIGDEKTLFLLYGKKGFAPITFKFLYKDQYGTESWSQWLNKKQINKLFSKE